MTTVRAPWFGIMLGTLAAACGAKPDARTPVPAEAVAEPRPSATPLPPLSEAEQASVDALRRHVEMLAGKIGERNTQKKWELAEASDYLAGELEGLGYSLERQGYDVADIVAQNLSVGISGGRLAKEIVVVGAHYDTARGTPGADDNASGVAAVLELAKALRGTKSQRTLRFVLFANEEQPFFQTENMGSLVYAKRASAQGETINAVLSIESIGYYCDQPGCQRYPDELGGRFPNVGDFIAVIGNEPSRPLVDEVYSAFLAHGSLPAQAAALPSDVKGVGWSDHWSFWQFGWHAVMITDTAPFRNPHYHRPSDTPATLDFERMARVVVGLAGVVRRLAGIS